MHTNYGSNVIFFASPSGTANRASKPKSNLNFEFEFEFELDWDASPTAMASCAAVLCCVAIRLPPLPYRLHSYDLIPSQLCSAVQTDNQQQQQRTAPHPKSQGLESRRAKTKISTGVDFRIQTINLPWHAGECTSSPPSAPLSEPL
jgi:hypothetical protein